VVAGIVLRRRRHLLGLEGCLWGHCLWRQRLGRGYPAALLGIPHDAPGSLGHSFLLQSREGRRHRRRDLLRFCHVLI
jgi:hypothetical protein